LHIFKMAANETNNVLPHKCISNKYENVVSDSSEYIFIRL